MLWELVFSDDEVTVILRVDIEPSEPGFRNTLAIPSSGTAFDGACAGGGGSVDSDVVSDAWAWEADADREVPWLRVGMTGPSAGVARSVDGSVASDAWEDDTDCEVPWVEGIPVATIGAYAGAAARSVDGDVVSDGWEDDGDCEIPSLEVILVAIIGACAGLTGSVGSDIVSDG